MASLDTLLQLSEQQCRQHRCEETITTLEEALLAEPASPVIRYQLGLCFSGACRRHRLTDPEIALEYFRSALSTAGMEVAPLLRAHILSALGNSYLCSSRLPKNACVLAAIDCYRQAADLYLAGGLLDDWAREQNNLGLAKCELPAESNPAKWAEAIDHFRRALVVRAAGDPERYAATLENLGTAYRSLPAGNRGDNVRKAMACYRHALRVYRASRYPVENAALHNNLGNAYLSLPAQNARHKGRQVRRALLHFEKALRVRTRSDRPNDYAVTQFNRGQAYLQCSGPEPRHTLLLAAECFREAAEAFESCGRRDQAAKARELWAAAFHWLPEAA